MIALAFQHRLELAPASVQHRLGHAGLREFRGAGIAHIDFAVLIHQPTREFVQCVLAPILDLGVDRLPPALVASPLGGGQLVYEIVVEATILQLLTVGAGRHVLQAQVDTDCALASGRLGLHLHRYVDVPPTPSILVEAGRPELVLAQSAAAPDLEVAAVVEHLPVLSLGGTCVNRNPAKGTARAPRFPPCQARLFELLAAGGVFLAYALHRVAVQA